jgi:squalene-associated FAD-dependent desaturase
MTNPPRTPAESPAVAIVGGGLAGMAAAAAAVAHGMRVELFEQAKALGGRAGSFHDPASDRLVDACQHIAMGCCTNLADFCRRTGVVESFRRYRTLHFVCPQQPPSPHQGEGEEGEKETRLRLRSTKDLEDVKGCYAFAASRWLPPPLHLLPGLLRVGYLKRSDRWAIARTLLGLARHRPDDRPDAPAIGPWLRSQGQSEEAIERFWSVVLTSALGETVERASQAAAQKVFLDGFLASRRAYELVVPQMPLGELWRQAAAWLSARGAAIHLGTRVEEIEATGRRTAAVVLGDGTRRGFDFCVAAVPWRQVRGLLCTQLRSALPDLERAEQLQPSPITAVHLWFDRAISSLPHAAIVPRGWFFADPRPRPPAWHYQVVLSGPHALQGRDREEIVRAVRADLEAAWPAARGARLVRWLVLAQPAAVFSARPGSDALRPPQRTPVENLLVAGDWTATGWPATMEGAVRSGYLAVEAILASLGRPERVLVKDLPRGWLVRLLGLG